MPYEVYKDTGFIEGTHEGLTNANWLKSTKVDFELAEAKGRLIRNTSDGSSGFVTAVTPRNPNSGFSYLYVSLSGGTTNQWNAGDKFSIHIRTVEDAKISYTVISKESGFAYPKRELVNGEHPDEMDME